MFGTSLKTGINCFCFKKNNYRNCNVEFLHDETRKDIEVAFANWFFFPETTQYTYNITVNKYIHNRIRMNGNNNSFKEQHLLVEIPA